MTVSALWCSSAGQTLPAVARSADYAYVLTAEVDQSKDAVGMSEPYWSYNQGDIEADLDAMVAMGVTNVRIQVPWVYVEPQQGVYDWATVDAIVEAADARGLGIVAIVSHTPSWAGDGGFNSVPDPEVYADFAGAVAQRYQGSINAYEVWNEPNGAMFYESTDPEDYTAMLQAAYTAIKEADSSNIVIAGVLGSSGTLSGVSLNPVEFVEGMYSSGAKDYFDVLSFHPYAYPLGTEFSAGEGYPGSAYEQLQAIWEVMEENSDSKQIWATEFGVPTFGDISEADQAAIIAEFLSAWSEFAYTGPMFIHSTSDLDSGSESVEDNFGIFYTNGDPKLAVEAIAQWIEEQQQVEEPDPVDPPTSPGYDLGAALQAFVANVVGQVTAFVQGVSDAVGRIITGIVDAVTRPFTRLSAATSEQTQSVEAMSTEPVSLASEVADATDESGSAGADSEPQSDVPAAAAEDESPAAEEEVRISAEPAAAETDAAVDDDGEGAVEVEAPAVVTDETTDDTAAEGDGLDDDAVVEGDGADDDVAVDDSAVDDVAVDGDDAVDEVAVDDDAAVDEDDAAEVESTPAALDTVDTAEGDEADSDDESREDSAGTKSDESDDTAPSADEGSETGTAA